MTTAQLGFDFSKLKEYSALCVVVVIVGSTIPPLNKFLYFRHQLIKMLKQSQKL